MKFLGELWRRLRRKTRRSLVSRQAEVYLLSYPKCGRTWLRMLIGQMLVKHFDVVYADPMDLWGLTKKIREAPRVAVTHDDKPHRRSVEELQTDKSGYLGRRVILLVRDPRDALVSNYFHNKYRGKVFSGTLGEYVRRPRGGLSSILSYYNVWAAARKTPAEFLLVKYEDLHSRPLGVLQEIARFLGLHDVDNDTIERAIEASSFDKMRNLESSGDYNERRLQPGDPSDQRSFKTRKGKAGTYKEEFAPEDLSWLEGRIEGELDPFYEAYRYRTEL